MLDQSKDGPRVITKPPKIYAAFLVTGFILQYAWPFGVWESIVWMNCGVLLLICGVVIMTVSVRQFMQADTPVDTDLATEKIVITGIYKYSRNPIYVALTFVYLGIGLIINSGWILISIIPILVIMHYGVIKREEEYLTNKFQDEYKRYKQATRRWI